jgi:ATP-dependent DNA helicase RecG
VGSDKLDEIRQQTPLQDWSAQIVAGASVDDLVEMAVHKARESIAQKYANRFSPGEVGRWPMTAGLHP